MPSEPAALRPLHIQEQRSKAPYLLDTLIYPAHASPPMTPKPSPRATPYPNPPSRRSSYIPTTTTTGNSQSSSAPYEVRCVLPAAKTSPPIQSSPSMPSTQELVSLVHLQAQQVALQKQLEQVAAQQRMIALQLSALLAMNQQKSNKHDFSEVSAMSRGADEDILAGLMFEM
ncbi:hypothetical protein HDU81_004069 [Chytriomyces hyalinus]|nr:hypothetical protein HDU81_004069 [Chytriomyces hyalinus]